jgi:TIR domain
MADVFISHIHEDAELALAVKDFLQAKLGPGREIFVSADQGQLLVGENWLARIRRELMSAKIVMLMLTPRSVARPWVNFEAGAAWLADKVIIPICCGTRLKGRLPKPYADFQALELPKEADYLLRSVAGHLGIETRGTHYSFLERDDPLLERLKGACTLIDLLDMLSPYSEQRAR